MKGWDTDLALLNNFAGFFLLDDFVASLVACEWRVHEDVRRANQYKVDQKEEDTQ